MTTDFAWISARNRRNTQLAAFATFIASFVMAAAATGADDEPRSIAPPTTFLALDQGDARDSLSVKTGQPTTLRLRLPISDDWSTANIGFLAVRTGQSQVNVHAAESTPADFSSHTFSEPGDALIALSAGPSAERSKSDSWQRTPYCCKLIVRVNAPDGAPANTDASTIQAGLTAKVGQRIELVPLVPPTALRPGDHLPVRVFFNNGKRAGATLTAFRPDGATDSKRTDAVGAATFAITLAGRWLIRYEEPSDGTTYVADLAFEVLPIAPVEEENK